MTGDEDGAAAAPEPPDAVGEAPAPEPPDAVGEVPAPEEPDTAPDAMVVALRDEGSARAV